MKKIFSILLAAVMLITVSVSAFSVFADEVLSPESTTKSNKITVEVNGNESNDVTYEKDPTDPTKITFTYTGDGELEGWEFPGMTEDVDYKIISKDGDSITIQIINGYDGPIIANAIVKDDSGKKKSNDKKKSPKTGAATVSVAAAAGVGIAMLAALKRKSDEE